MGYFKRTIRRGAARAERDAFLDPARDINVADWQRCDLNFQSADSFLRFVIEWSRGRKVGLFRSSEVFDPPERLSADARTKLRNVFRWFNANLTVPRGLPPDAVCWFRSDAKNSLKQIRSLVEIYKVAGYRVWMQGTQNPGRVVYRDALQVAAVPYLDRAITTNAL